ncbi:MAG: phosphotransferase family protein [Deltaproteobacteria bacterium]|nr:phosphotransferase family protein [Deltaproteobacteria bacterium]MBW2445961.1 phosphotransferase family protein [Deltaproteobacteria bacterium]
MLSADRKEGLELYLEKELDLRGPCRIRSEERMARGQSRAMYRLEIESEGAGRPERRSVVLRVEQWGLLGTESSQEVRVMRALHLAGYPVAEVLAYEPSSELLGQPFFVMEFVEGSCAFVREGLDEYVQTLHRLHGMDPEETGLGFLGHPEGRRGAALSQVERWYEVHRDAQVGEPSPLLEEAAQWLRNNAPESDRITIVHGDPGPGNYMQRDGRLACVVDWEFTHRGDPEEDWAYLISMRGMGVMDEDAWATYLRELVGVELDRDRLHYWKALNFFKGVCIDATALKIYLDRDNLAPNMLAIGTVVYLNALKRLAEAVAA